MPANSSGFLVGYWHGVYGRLGWLYNAMSDATRRIHPAMPWALDNGVYGAFIRDESWDADAFYDALDTMYLRWHECYHPPRWIAVPDSVGNRTKTLALWREHSGKVASYGAPLAFVVQDGMTADDVPRNADVVFIGGSTAWKWATVEMWCDAYERVHVGRVNAYDKLMICDRLGAESVDGTGLMRTDRQREGLRRYLEHTHTPTPTDA